MGGYNYFLKEKFKNYPTFNPTIFIQSKKLLTNAPYKTTTPSFPQISTISEALSYFFGVKVIPHGNWVYEMTDTGTIFYFNDKIMVLDNNFVDKF